MVALRQRRRRSSGAPSGPISANRTYDIFNENGWGRSLHFLAAWWLGRAGVRYLLIGTAQRPLPQ